jgi:APA family basic amino acid/polyamine antiporter
MPPPPAGPAESAPRQQLSLVDSTSIIVGIIIGSAIYEVAPVVASGAAGWMAESLQGWARFTGASPPSPGAIQVAGVLAILGVWTVGGLIALLGAMCYAELATAFPQAGGTYVYLSEGLGRSVGFAFAWAEFWVVRPGNVGAVAFVLARYGAQLLPQAWAQWPYCQLVLAAAAILTISLVNAVGLRAGKWTQNILTACKLLGLAAIVIAAVAFSPERQVTPPANPTANISLALIMVMFAFGGWSDMSFVAAEVRDPSRNIFRALLLGTGAVLAIYLAVNVAFVQALGLDGLIQSPAAAAEVLQDRVGPWGSKAISLLVVVSCLGAINGMLFTGARVYYALGTHHPVFRWLGSWNDRSGVPLRSLAMQTIVTVALVIGFGLYTQGFSRLVNFTAPFYWGFIGLVGIALIAIRERVAVAKSTAGFQVPLFPVLPALFAVSSAAMVYASVSYALQNLAREVWWATAIVVVGAFFCWLDYQTRQQQAR